VTRDRAHPALTIESLVAERCIVGSPEDCVEQIREYEKLGVTEILLRVHHAHLSHAAVMGSLSLFAREVLPASA
jgi:alkanesulfonate monooxygenase SsuD/methylene tetrahydromethanopterin reductase-like flavin-dependent oxidoreductase (luciferase family)